MSWLKYPFGQNSQPRYPFDEKPPEQFDPFAGVPDIQPSPSNWMHALNLLGATLKDYSDHGRSNNIALTQDAIQKHKEATARLAPHLPPDILGQMYVARLNGDYDPAAGKYAIPGLGIYPRDTQSRFPGDGMPFMPPRGFGSNNPVLARTIPPARGLTAGKPMPDASGPFESPFVRAAFASLAASQAQERATDQSIASTGATYPGGGRSRGSLYGGVLTPIVRVETPGNHSKDHNPDTVLGSGDPKYEIHPEWSGYDREELPGGGLVSAFGTWSTKQKGWEYSSDGGHTWKPLHSEDEDLKAVKPQDLFKLQPNDNDNPKGYIFRFTGA